MAQGFDDHSYMDMQWNMYIYFLKNCHIQGLDLCETLRDTLALQKIAYMIVKFKTHLVAFMNSSCSWRVVIFAATWSP